MILITLAILLTLSIVCNLYQLFSRDELVDEIIGLENRLQIAEKMYYDLEDSIPDELTQTFNIKTK